MTQSIPFGRPVMGVEEKRAVEAVMDSGLLVHGPVLKEFEAAFAGFTGTPHAVGVSSCTAGLHLSYFALGVGSGDEVIVPAMTHTATAHAVELLGARPVFVDAEAATGNLDLDRVEGCITERTRAISLVHFLGMPVDMTRIMAIANAHELHVVEDCALALGARLHGKHVGLSGTTGCFSFYPVKHMTTAEGGVVTVQDAELAARLAHLRAFGVDRHHGERRVAGEYDVTALGFNYRMSEVHAAIGCEQLKRLPRFLEARRRNYERLTERLKVLEEIELLQSSHDAFESSYYCHCIILREPWAGFRPRVMEALKARGVGTSIYYPRPVPLMSYYRNKYGFSADDFPIASRISDRSIALPVGPHLHAEEVDVMANHIKEVLWRMRQKG